MFAEECDPNQVYRAACPSSRSLNIEYDEARAGSTCHRLDQQWPTGATPADITPRHGGHARAHSARSLRAHSERENPPGLLPVAPDITIRGPVTARRAPSH